jgi:hypothetical protein
VATRSFRLSVTQRSLLVVAILALAFFGYWVSRDDGPAPPPSPAPSASSGAPVPADVRKQLDELTVAARTSMDGYSREKFPHWDSQGSGCDTREVVLKRAGKDVRADKDCKPTSGTWISVYDDETWTDPTDLDIDHMVPLGQAWASGAKTWPTEKREQFANDLVRPQLFAVTDNVNQQKSDKAPDQWKPPLVAFWCTYATDWIVVKHHYGLTVTEGEKTALTDMLRRC